MISITTVLNDSINIPLYIQLYTYIKDSIFNNDISPGERLPSLRALSKTLNLSLTTIELAYNQLLVEGYISSKPQSGYYVNDIRQLNRCQSLRIMIRQTLILKLKKWKNASIMLNEYSHLLFER